MTRELLAACALLVAAASTAGAQVAQVDVQLEAHVEATVTATAEVSADVRGITIGGGPPVVVASSGEAEAAAEIDALAAPHWEAGLAMLVVTDLGSGGPSPAAMLGRQLGPVRVSLDYMRYDRTLDAALSICPVSTSRIGATMRYRASMSVGVGGMGGYLEGGIGRETSTLKDGRQLHATSYVAGLGFETLLGGRRSMGFDLGFRFLVDERDTLTGLFQLGVLFGSR